MKKFNFRLETLLHYRKNIEEKERLELLRLYFQMHTEINRRTELLDRQRETLAELKQKRDQGPDDPEVHWFYAYLGKLQSQIAASSQQIARLERSITDQRSTVVEASKNKKIVDGLKTKKVKQFNAEAEKQEQKTVDEIVTTRFVHKEP